MKRTFVFRGQTYDYFCHPYNTTWNNERTVEIPIVSKIVSEYREKNILEVGNVLSHYFNCQHDVLDKYETADPIIHQDAVDFHPSKKYDLIVSISTIEHIGWDEQPKEPEKGLCTLKNLVQCLAPGGQMVVTFPLVYNPALDRLFEDGKLPFTEQYYLKRISDREWKEAGWGEVRGTKYDGYNRAIVIGTTKRR